MIVHYTFTIHLDHKEKVKEELEDSGEIKRRGGRNFKYFASMTSGTPNRLFIYGA